MEGELARSSYDIADAAPLGGFGEILMATGRFWPTRRLARAALRIMRKRDMIPKFVATPLNGRRIALDLDENVDTKIFLYGAYDERGLKLIKRVMHAIGCRTAIDVGANIGAHTAHFCDWAQQVYAFEPNPPVFARLQRFISANKLSNVTAFPCGLSDKDGELPFYIFPGRAHLTTFEPSPDAVPAGRAAVRQGDSIVEENHIANIDVVKIDVEEHEYEVLKGFQATLARDKPILFMEFKESSIGKFGGPEGLAALLEGYRIFGTGPGLMSKLFKTALRLEPFIVGKYYVHLLCVPERHASILTKLGLAVGA
jgi:FkbM family methyltransferase